MKHEYVQKEMLLLQHYKIYLTCVTIIYTHKTEATLSNSFSSNKRSGDSHRQFFLRKIHQCEIHLVKNKNIYIYMYIGRHAILIIVL